MATLYTQQSKKYWFFGSKLNTALLLVLIILMVVALRLMYKEKSKYFPTIIKDNQNSEKLENSTDDKYTEDNFQQMSIFNYEGVTFKYPSIWKLEKVYDERGRQEGLRLNGTASENQVIWIGQSNKMWNKEIYNIETINGVTFVIPKGLSEDSQKVFIDIVNSVKNI